MFEWSFKASFNALSASTSSAVLELLASNNLDVNEFEFTIDTGKENITPDDPLNITDDVFIFVETDYDSAGAYKPNALVNSSEHNDSQNTVVII